MSDMYENMDDKNDNEIKAEIKRLSKGDVGDASLFREELARRYMKRNLDRQEKINKSMLVITRFIALLTSTNLLIVSYQLIV